MPGPLNTIISAVNALMVATQPDLITHIGANYVMNEEAPPRIVWEPANEALIPPNLGRGGEPRILYLRQSNLAVHLFAVDLDSLESLLGLFIQSVHHTVSHASYALGAAQWINVDGENLKYGVAYVIQVSFKIPAADSVTNYGVPAEVDHIPTTMQDLNIDGSTETSNVMTIEAAPAGQGCYYGVAVPPNSYTQAFIVTTIGTQGTAVSPTRQRTIAYNSTGAQKDFYCIPVSFGGINDDFIDAQTGWLVGFSIAAVVNVSTASGVIPYNVWVNDVAGLGVLTVNVI